MNGIDITVAPHDQAVALLTGIRGEISLVVSRDHDDDADNDVTPQPTSHDAASTVTWPTTPLDADLPIIVQPPTPNYAVVEAPTPPSPQQAPASVVKDVAAVAKDAETVETVASEPLSPDLIDLGGDEAAAVTSHDDVIIVPEVEIPPTTADLMTFDQFRNMQFDVGDDDDDFEYEADEEIMGAAAAGVSWSPMSSDIRDMIQQGMLETLRLL